VTTNWLLYHSQLQKMWQSLTRPVNGNTYSLIGLLHALRRQHKPRDTSADKFSVVPQNCRSPVLTLQTKCLHH